jgi:hypothetical protein
VPYCTENTDVGPQPNEKAKTATINFAKYLIFALTDHVRSHKESLEEPENAKRSEGAMVQK